MGALKLERSVGPVLAFCALAQIVLLVQCQRISLSLLVSKSAGFSVSGEKGSSIGSSQPQTGILFYLGEARQWQLVTSELEKDGGCPCLPITKKKKNMRVRVFSHEMTRLSIRPFCRFTFTLGSAFLMLSHEQLKKGNKEKESSVRQIGLIYSIV